MFPQFPSNQPVFISLDLGLRFGWAFYTDLGRLIGYGSHHCAGRPQLKKCAYALIQSLPEHSELWIEGGGALLKFWSKPALKKGVFFQSVHAHQWRNSYFGNRQDLSGKEAKKKAVEWATHLIAFHCDRETERSPVAQSSRQQSRYDRHAVLKMPNTHELRHDAAEAILMGWWALFQRDKIEVGSFKEGVQKR